MTSIDIATATYNDAQRLASSENLTLTEYAEERLSPTYFVETDAAARARVKFLGTGKRFKLPEVYDSAPMTGWLAISATAGGPCCAGRKFYRFISSNPALGIRYVGAGLYEFV